MLQRRGILLCLALFLLISIRPASAQQNPEDLTIPDNPAPAATPPASKAHAMPAEAMSGDAAPGDALPAANWLNLGATFRQGFLRQALWAGVLVALMCGYLGLYVVLKRVVFVGVALAEVSSAGLALALWLGLSPLVGAIGFMLAGVTLFSLRTGFRRVPPESIIGIVYALAGALGILFVARSAQGESHMLALLQGDVLTVDPRETWQMAGAFGLVALCHAAFVKEWTLVSFDREEALTLGFRAGGWEFALFLTIGLAIAFSIRAVGTLLATAMLLLPAATALMLASRMNAVRWLAPLLAVVPVVLGLHLSFVADLPASAVITALSVGIFALAVAWRASRGGA